MISPPASPLPWSVNGFGDIVDADDRVVLPNGWYLFREDRAAIIAAVNERARLREALEELTSIVDHAVDQHWEVITKCGLDTFTTQTAHRALGGEK